MVNISICPLNRMSGREKQEGAEQLIVIGLNPIYPELLGLRKDLGARGGWSKLLRWQSQFIPAAQLGPPDNLLKYR
jgi:hypothetical protein